MAEKRILYLTVLAASLVFFWAYRQWLSWVVLVLVVLLPWLSLALSLRAMRRMELCILCPEKASMGQHVPLNLVGRCDLPQPQTHGRMQLRNYMTGQTLTRRSSQLLPTAHCGMWSIQVEKARVHDYLGLFTRRLKNQHGAIACVLPTPVAIVPAPDLTKYLATAFKPKPGGGYAENHELRLYRPGDNLHQIHWKLTAKTGKLILREPMEPIKGKAVVSLELSGSEAVVDEKLGMLLWLSRYLLDEGVPHEIHCLSADGIHTYPIAHRPALDKAIVKVMKLPLAPAGEKIDFIAASWKYHIGGDRYES